MQNERTEILGPSRRDFNKTLTAAVSALGMGSRSLEAADRLSAIGVQLYTVRNVILNNPQGVLKSIEAIGYRDAGRVPLLHLKNKAEDMGVQFNEAVPPTAFREVGKGSLDIPVIVRTAKSIGTKHFFVEQDQTPGDPLESLRASYSYLSALRF